MEGARTWGAAYTSGAGDPPCGVTFRSSTPAAPVEANVVWHLSWKATDGTGDDLGTTPMKQTETFTVWEAAQTVAGN